MILDPHEKAAQVVIAFITADGSLPTEEQIRGLVAPAIEMTGQELDEERVVRLVKAKVNVFSPAAATLDDNTGHEPWLADARAGIEWCFWDRYRIWLVDAQGFPSQVVRRLDDVTDDVLGRLENPQRPGSWDRRGLVVGQVQSGKTANYMGLICKAADAGYKLVVVLAGIHNSLRAQTQHRLDEAFLGLDSARKTEVGVGRLAFDSHPFAVSLTDSTDSGDFKISTANAATMRLGSDPLVVIIKKNATILRTFLRWVTGLNQSPDLDGRPVVEGVPLLLIDDEADNASINTRTEDLDPTVINGLVRSVLDRFEKAAYVGYTATPFANLFISEHADHDSFGKDLFPSSFIVALRPPSDYTGPGDVFGMSAIPELEQEARDGLPLTRPIRDHESWIPDRHKKDLQPGPLPDSLKTAVMAFVLSVAARRSRGQHSHNSMLLHVTRFNAVQNRVREQVSDYLSDLRNAIRYGGDRSDVMTELERLWTSDYAATTSQIAVGRPELVDASEIRSWADVRPELKTAVEHIEVRLINGLASDALDYASHERGLSVIAVGGDKLSRGLTLEGLSVSYYLRATRMYDTLMQMGRWFGYRPGYIDLCRMFTTDELISWYRDIAAATEELWTEFEYMASINKTPEEFGLRVRTHPGGLLVTAAAKMRNGEKRTLSYSGAISEAVGFHTDETNRRHDLTVLETLLASLPPSDPSDPKLVWRHVPPKPIVQFFGQLNTPPDARRVRPDLIGRYIQSAAQRGELTDWTVVLIDNTQTKKRFPVWGLDVGLTFRKRNNEGEADKYAIQRLLDPTHEALDLTDEERALALQRTRDVWDKNKSKRKSPPDEPSGRAVRATRPAERGLLLLYLLLPEDGGTPYTAFGVSFPIGFEAQPIEYIVNNVYLQLELEVELADEG
jgi:hypothetical protein